MYKQIAAAFVMMSTFVGQSFAADNIGAGVLGRKIHDNNHVLHS